jgi:hypothetical protein
MYCSVSVLFFTVVSPSLHRRFEGFFGFFSRDSLLHEKSHIHTLDALGVHGIKCGVLDALIM